MDAKSWIAIAAIVVAALINADRGRILERLKRLEDELHQLREERLVVRVSLLEQRTGTPRPRKD